MKKIMYCAALLTALTFTSCTKDEPNVTPEPETPIASDSHLDLFLSVKGTSSTGTFVARVDDPTNTEQTVNVTGSGVEITGKINIGAIQKDGYYYFATEGDDGIVKYKLTGTQLVSVGECPYGEKIFKKGQMTGAISASHEWIGDNVLLLSQYISTTKKHIWAKFDTQSMKLIDEGEFDLHEKYPDAYKFSTSGHIRYRKADGKLLFFTSIHYKGEGVHPMTGAPNTVRGPLAVAIIDEKTMAVEETFEDDRVSGLALEAYGDTQQEKAYFDENGDLYLICLMKGSNYKPGGPIPECVIIRMKSGEKETDKSYLFQPVKDTNILIVKYLSPGKALFFVGDHERYYNGNKADSENYVYDAYYYAIFDSAQKTLTRVKVGDVDLPWSTGGFNNYIAQIGNSVYLGVNSVQEGDTHQALVYSLDIPSGEVKKAFSIDAGLDFLRMHSVKNVAE